jgi:hypothetical protein
MIAVLESRFCMAKHKRSDGHAIPSQPKPKKNHCFACGNDNPQGMKLKFYRDEEARRTICHFNCRAAMRDRRVMRMAVSLPPSWMKRWAR